MRTRMGLFLQGSDFMGIFSKNKDIDVLAKLKKNKKIRKNPEWKEKWKKK